MACHVDQVVSTTWMRAGIDHLAFRDYPAAAAVAGGGSTTTAATATTAASAE